MFTTLFLLCENTRHWLDINKQFPGEDGKVGQTFGQRVKSTNRPKRQRNMLHVFVLIRLMSLKCEEPLTVKFVPGTYEPVDYHRSHFSVFTT